MPARAGNAIEAPAEIVVVEAEGACDWLPDSRKAIGLVALSVVAGVALVAVAGAVSIASSTGAVPLFWTGLLVLFAPAAWALVTRPSARYEALSLLVLVVAGLFAVKILRSPVVFKGFDELLHYRSLEDLVQTGALFRPNPLLPISPYYPGLEIVTQAIVSLTGLPLFQAGLLVVGVARILITTSLFLFLERVAVPPRLAALGMLAYTAAPSFLFFDSMFAYESLALPLAVVCVLLLRMAQSEDGWRRLAYNGLALLAAIAVIVTHHVTSFVLIGALLAWLVAAFIVGERDALPGQGCVPLAALAAMVFWLTSVAGATVGYVFPHIVSGMNELVRIITREGPGRQLFQSAGGTKAPILERFVGLASAGLLAVSIPIGIVYVWKRQRQDLLAVLLAFAALSYPLSMVLRLTQSGWEIGARAATFVFLPLAFVVAAAYERLCETAMADWEPALRAVTATALLTVIFTGGVIAGSSSLSRLPQPYLAGAGTASIEAEGVAAAVWARDVLGPDHRVAGDSVNASLMGSYGRQRIISSGDGVSISELFLGGEFGEHQRQQIGEAHIEYLVMDRRIAGVVAPSGYFYEKWERGILPIGSTVSTETVSQFDRIDHISRIFDSGDIQLYNVTGVAQ